MKKVLFIVILITTIGALSSHAQRVRVRLDFPAGIAVAAPVPPPFTGAVWIGPEWTWRGGQYVCAPGYWAHPALRRGYWAPGHWQYSRHGYEWRRGHWR